MVELAGFEPNVDAAPVILTTVFCGKEHLQLSYKWLSTATAICSWSTNVHDRSLTSIYADASKDSLCPQFKLPAFKAVHLEKSKIFLEAEQLSYRIKMLFYEEGCYPGKIFGVFSYRAEDI